MALQQDALKEARCEKTFVKQMSRAVSDRPALPEALDYARSGDTLIVWKLDRLARSMKQLIETIEKLRVRNIGFRSLTEAIDTTTAQGVLVFHMFSALAEFERALIRERTRTGLPAARRAGRTGGRPPKLIEDDLDVAKTLLANPGITVADVADRLGVSPADAVPVSARSEGSKQPFALNPWGFRENLHARIRRYNRGVLRMVVSPYRPGSVDHGRPWVRRLHRKLRVGGTEVLRRFR